jgi:hypothetical protein
MHNIAPFVSNYFKKNAYFFFKVKVIFLKKKLIFFKNNLKQMWPIPVDKNWF